MPAHPGRAVFGSNGALAVLVAARGADLGLGVDTGGDVAVAAACVGALAFRCSYGALEVLDARKRLLVASASCAAPVVVCHTPAMLGKVCSPAAPRCF